MDHRFSRRAMLRGVLAGGMALGVQHSSPAISGPRAGTPPPGIEPLIRLLVETPRERVLETVGETIRRGAGFLDVLAALLLAGVREVQPRPSVGFKFHTVLAVISYHLIGNKLSERDRPLPVFWGIDYFKVAQASDAAEGDWKLGPVDEAAVPTVEKTGQALVEAMQCWDEPAADAAAAAVARRLAPEAAFELFYPLGARDFRSIGHKAIFVMCAQRMLGLIGWEHAEPVLRSLAYALLMHEDGNPADRDDPADRPWRQNEKIVGKIRGDWTEGRSGTDPRLAAEATTELLAILRNGSSGDVADAVIEQLNRGAFSSSIWDAIFCGAAELQLRAPNIVSLHAVTTTRAIHHAYRTSGQDRTRRLLLLQNAALLPMFRDAAAGRGHLQDTPIDELEPIEPQGSDEAAMKKIFEDLGGQRRVAAQRIFGYLQAGRPAKLLLEKTRQLVAVKGNGAHDFKFTSAALESFDYVSEAWRGRYLACGTMHFCGPDERDSAIVQRTRTALGT